MLIEVKEGLYIEVDDVQEVKRTGLTVYIRYKGDSQNSRIYAGGTEKQTQQFVSDLIVKINSTRTFALLPLPPAQPYVPPTLYPQYPLPQTWCTTSGYVRDEDMKCTCGENEGCSSCGG